MEQPIIYAKDLTKKFGKFILAFPFIVLGTISFCSGIWDEISDKSDFKIQKGN